VNKRVFIATTWTLAAAVLAVFSTTLLLVPAVGAEEMAAVGAPRLAESVWIWGMVSAAAATALSALAAAYAVGQVGSAAMGVMAEKPEAFGRLLIFVGLAEGIAIYGLIVSVLILTALE